MAPVPFRGLEARQKRAPERSGDLSTSEPKDKFLEPPMEMARRSSFGAGALSHSEGETKRAPEHRCDPLTSELKVARNLGEWRELVFNHFNGEGSEAVSVGEFFGSFFVLVTLPK